MGQRSEGQLDFVPYDDPRLESKLELCSRLGKIMVLVDATGLDPLLVPLLQTDWRNCTNSSIQMGRKHIDVSQTFSLVITTKMAEPCFLPGLQSLVSIVSFAATTSGVSDQLLSTILHYKEPELEKQILLLSQKEVTLKGELAGLEQKLLETLASTEGDLLENDTLIRTLTMTKDGAEEIHGALEMSRTASLELERKRSMYKRFADKCSHLYFLMLRASNVSLSVEA